MSSRAKILQQLYKKGKVTKEGLRKAVIDEVITPEEYEIIVGEPFIN